MHTDAGNVLLRIARSTISAALGLAIKTQEDAPWLRDNGASFVTLKLNETLRGCVGSLTARRPLLDDLKANAYAAAFKDPRFSPLAAQELQAVRVEVSVLSATTPIEFSDKHDALEKLRPNIDGVIFQYKEYCSTFLPQVWESLPRPEDFIAQLKEKAGLPVDFWENDIRLSRYTVTKWRENE